MVLFNRTIFKTNFLIILISIMLFMISFHIPVEYSFENHAMENTEVVILFIGLVSVLYRRKHTYISQSKPFWMGCALLYAVMIMRELSWGRVFFPVGVSSSGESVFIKMNELWFAPIIYAVVAMMVCGALYCMAKSFKECRRRGLVWNVPIWHFAVFALMMIVSQCVFEKGLIFVSAYGQLLEESAEIVAYLSLVCFTGHFYFVRRQNEWSRNLSMRIVHLWKGSYQQWML